MSMPSSKALTLLRCSLFPAPCSLLSAPYYILLCIWHYHSSLLPDHWSLLPAPCSAPCSPGVQADNKVPASQWRRQEVSSAPENFWKGGDTYCLVFSLSMSPDTHTLFLCRSRCMPPSLWTWPTSWRARGSYPRPSMSQRLWTSQSVTTPGITRYTRYTRYY